jgi:hypothetical protein
MKVVVSHVFREREGNSVADKLEVCHRMFSLGGILPLLVLDLILLEIKMVFLFIVFVLFL